MSDKLITLENLLTFSEKCKTIFNSTPLIASGTGKYVKLTTAFDTTAFINQSPLYISVLGIIYTSSEELIIDTVLVIIPGSNIDMLGLNLKSNGVKAAAYDTVDEKLILYIKLEDGDSTHTTRLKVSSIITNNLNKVIYKPITDIQISASVPTFTSFHKEIAISLSEYFTGTTSAHLGLKLHNDTVPSFKVDTDLNGTYWNYPVDKDISLQITKSKVSQKAEALSHSILYRYSDEASTVIRTLKDSNNDDYTFDSGKVAVLESPNLTRGKFLSLWNCNIGLPFTDPIPSPSSTNPYNYTTGDYYIVGQTNKYKHIIKMSGQALTTLGVSEGYEITFVLYLLGSTKETTLGGIYGKLLSLGYTYNGTILKAYDNTGKIGTEAINGITTSNSSSIFQLYNNGVLMGETTASSGVEYIADPSIASYYKPVGSRYIGNASTTVDSGEPIVDDVYYYDGSLWKLQHNTHKDITIQNVVGLSDALNDKLDKITNGSAVIASLTNGIVSIKSGVSLVSGTISNSSGADITLSKVATSGSYSDLSNKPSIPSAQVNSDWNSTSGLSKILNKPNLATVATSGNYYHLSNRPDIPTAKLSDWTQTDSSLIDYIQHKPADVPIGTIVMWGGSEDSVPDGWLLCDGSFIFVKRELWNASHTGSENLKWSRGTGITSEYTSDYGQLFLNLGGTNLINTTSSDFINSKGFSTLLMDVNPSTDTLYFTINGTNYLMSVSDNVCTKVSTGAVNCSTYMKELKMVNKFNTTVSDLEDANIVHAGTVSSNGACWYGVMVYGDLSVKGGSSIGPAQYMEVYMKVPDMRLRFPLGAQDSTIATGSDTTSSTKLFSSGGASEVKLTSDESALPKHTHPLTVKTVLFIGGTGGSTALTDHSEGASGISIYGSDDDNQFPRMANTELSQANKAHNNTPPYLALNFIIKYK